jgi:hypothetical protein
MPSFPLTGMYFLDNKTSCRLLSRVGRWGPITALLCFESKHPRGSLHYQVHFMLSLLQPIHWPPWLALSDLQDASVAAAANADALWPQYSRATAALPLLYCFDISSSKGILALVTTDAVLAAVISCTIPAKLAGALRCLSMRLLEMFTYNVSFSALYVGKVLPLRSAWRYTGA